MAGTNIRFRVDDLTFPIQQEDLGAGIGSRQYWNFFASKFAEFLSPCFLVKYLHNSELSLVRRQSAPPHHKVPILGAVFAPRVVQ